MTQDSQIARTGALRRWRRVIIVLSVLSLVVAGSVWRFFPLKSTAEKLMLDYLHQHGVAEASLRVTAFDTEHMVLEGLTLGAQTDIAIGHAEIEYRAGELLHGRIRSLSASDVSLRPVRERGAFALPSLTALLASPGEMQQPGALTLPVEKLSLSRVALEAEGIKAGIGELSVASYFSGPQKIVSTITLRDIAAPEGWIVPLSLRAQGVLQADAVTLSGEAADAQNRMRLPFSLTHRMQEGGGRLELSLLPVMFAGDGLQPVTLVPAIKDMLGPTEGRISARAHLAWEAQKPLTQQWEVTLDNLSTQVKSTIIGGIDGTVRFRSLAPLATDGRQKVKIALLELGVPLSRGELSFTLAPDGMLSLAPTRWQWAGGELATNALSVNIHSPQLKQVTLSVKNVELEKLVALFLKDGVSATGTLSGILPVSFKDGQVMVRRAGLGAGAGGIIRYRPEGDSPLAQAGGGQSDILLKALEDFHYQTVQMKIDSQSPELLAVDLTIFGNNPALYGGKAIELNVHLQGNLIDLVRSGLNAYHLPETLQERLLTH